jgi:hypothetical protein
VKLYLGLHQPFDARHFLGGAVCISINRLRRRRTLTVGRWIIDSGAFSEVARHGRYRSPVADYAAEVRRWAGVGQLDACVAQDWMCEPFICAKTGKTVAEHQRLTIERYDELVAELGGAVYAMPMLQGYAPGDYVRHLGAYGRRLRPGMWAGVGNLCKRNGRPKQILAVLEAIRGLRPDLRLHGFGVKLTALAHPGVRAGLASADSMAWSFHARKNGRDPNCWREAEAFAAAVARVQTDAPRHWQAVLPL